MLLGFWVGKYFLKYGYCLMLISLDLRSCADIQSLQVNYFKQLQEGKLRVFSPTISRCWKETHSTLLQSGWYIYVLLTQSRPSQSAEDQYCRQLYWKSLQSNTVWVAASPPLTQLIFINSTWQCLTTAQHWLHTPAPGTSRWEKIITFPWIHVN